MFAKTKSMFYNVVSDVIEQLALNGRGLVS